MIRPTKHPGRLRLWWHKARAKYHFNRAIALSRDCESCGGCPCAKVHILRMEYHVAKQGGRGTPP